MSPTMSSRVRARTPYARLGITHDAVLRQPTITHELRRMASAIPDRANAPTDPYYYLNISDDADARRILDMYYLISRSDRHKIPIEAYCVAAGVPTIRCMALVAAAMVQSGASAQKVVAAVAMPTVVTEVIRRALDGDRDDCTENVTILAKATGFLPAPGGSRTQINVNASAKSDAVAQAAAPIAIVAAPSPEMTIRRLVDRFNESVLPAAAMHTQLPESSGQNPIEVLSAPGKNPQEILSARMMDVDVDVDIEDAEDDA